MEYDMKKILSIAALLSLVSFGNIITNDGPQPANSVSVAKLTPADRPHARKVCAILNKHIGEQSPRLTASELSDFQAHIREISADIPKARNFKKTSQTHKSSPEGLRAARRELRCLPVYSK